MKIVVLLVSLGLNVTLQIKISTLSFNYFSFILLVLIFLSSEFIIDPKKPLKLDYEVQTSYIIEMAVMKWSCKVVIRKELLNAFSNAHAQTWSVLT